MIDANNKEDPLSESNMDKSPIVLPGQEGTDGQGQENSGKPEESASTAIEYIYKDAETFGSLVSMLKSNKTNPESGIAQAAVSVIAQLEKDGGELSKEELAAAGIAVVMSLLDLANKAGVLPEITDEIGIKAWGETLRLFMEMNPGRIDPADLQAIADGNMPGESGGEQVDTTQQQQVPTEEPGLLGDS